MVRDSRRACARWRDWAIVLLIAFAAPAAADTIIVDNLDPEFTILSGSGWVTYDAPGQWSWNYLYYYTSDPVSEVEWRPTIPLAGEYEVAVGYRAVPVRPHDAHYTVHYDGGTADHYVDQTQNGEQWVTLGSYEFAAGSTGRVTLTTDAEPDTNIVADAVRFRSTRVGLTMAVSPPDAGSTVPATARVPTNAKITSRPPCCGVG